jgi:hypothetical protein
MFDNQSGFLASPEPVDHFTLPLALDRALQALADQKHCGNKSAAIRELLYKEAGMPAKLRMNEKKDTDSIANAESRSLKYGSRKKTKSKK